MRLAGRVLVSLMVAAPHSVCADEWSGNIELAWREITVDGADNKYRQHINLNDGGRLRTLQLTYRADPSGGYTPDEMSINAQNLGGDPFQNAQIIVRKYDRYNFRYHRRTSAYFYDDLLVALENEDIERSVRGDLHQFDVDREQDSTALELTLSDKATAQLGFERIARRGRSTTTRDVQRDEFDVDQVIDEVDQAVSAGFEYRWDTVSLTFRERYREYENRNSLLLPGASVGANPADQTTLDFFFVDQPYDYESHETTLGLAGRHFGRLGWRLDTTAIGLDLDLDVREDEQGIDFRGMPFSRQALGTGNVRRDMQLHRLSLDFAYSERLTINTALRHFRLDQTGATTIEDERLAADWDIESLGAELGLEIAFSDRAVLGVSWMTEQRDVDRFFAAITQPETVDTERNGFFATLDYRVSERFDLRATVENNRIDDPFTLASPTDTVHYRLRGRLRTDNGFSLIATHHVRDFENDNLGSNWWYRREHTDVRLHYRSERLRLALGSSFVDMSRDYLRRVRGGFREDLFDVAYRADARLLDGQLEYQLNDSLMLGGQYRGYRNQGSFAVDRHDAAIFVKYDWLQNYAVQLSYRTIDYDEDLEDYDASILELNFGIRW